MSEISHSNIAHQLRFYQSAAKAVHKKLGYVYQVKPEIPDATQRMIDAKLQEILTQGRWFGTRNRALRESDLETPQQVDRLETLSRDIAERYIEAFYLRERIMPVKTSNAYYTQRETKNHMLDIYLNHCCNEAELELQAFGLTPVSAHLVNGAMIAASVDAYRAYNPDASISCVRPEIGGVGRSAKPSTLESNIRTIREYWKPIKNRVVQERREFYGDPSVGR